MIVSCQCTEVPTELFHNITMVSQYGNVAMVQFLPLLLHSLNPPLIHFLFLLERRADVTGRWRSAHVYKYRHHRGNLYMKWS